MKKYKWGIVIILLSIEVSVLVFLGFLRWKNIDMTDTRLLITYWKEYLTSTILCLAGYLGIRKLMK